MSILSIYDRSKSVNKIITKESEKTIMGELVNLDLKWVGDVANNLIDKVYNATGLCFKEKSNNKVAQEELIEHLKKSDLPELEKCALISNAKKIIKEYSNKRDVMEMALDYLSESSKPSEMNEEWLDVFFDKVGLVTDKEFKLIWARLLAEECNENESVPKSLLYTLEQMNREDAENFMRLASIVVKINDKPIPLYLRESVIFYDKINLDYESLVQLDNLGLIEKDLDTGYNFFEEEDFSENVIIKYGNNKYVMPKEIKSMLCGSIIFTKKGMALFNAVNQEENEEFWEKIVIPFLKEAKTIN